MNHEKTHELFTVRRRLHGEVCIVPMPSHFLPDSWWYIVGSLRAEESNTYEYSTEQSMDLLCNKPTEVSE